MTGKTFLKAVTNGEVDIIQLMVSLLEKTGFTYCIIIVLGYESRMFLKVKYELF